MSSAGEQLARRRMFRRDAEHLAHGGLGGFVLVGEPIDLRAVKQQVRILRKLREAVLQDPARIVEAPALDEIESLLRERTGASRVDRPCANDA